MEDVNVIKEYSSSVADEFVETICVEEGRVWNLARHNERMNRTRRAFWGDDVSEIRLESWIHPEEYQDRTRCRVVYGEHIIKVEYFRYQMREVHSLKLVACDEADYQYKSSDRSQLNMLYEQRGKADDVLIVRNGLLTDTSIANVALFDGSEWYTPAYPLLKGTCRQLLLDEQKIRERDIAVTELECYTHIALFNAMIPFGKLVLETKFIK